MSAFKDLTGQRFGRLVVLRLTTKQTNSGNSIWEVRCDCGTLKTIAGGELTKGSTKSCGCLRKDRGRETIKVFAGSNKRDITGQTFGRLTAIRPTERRVDRKVVWELSCSCGNTAYATINNLISSSIKSCGCLQKEFRSINNRKHGLSKTKEYVAMRSRERKELVQLHDSKWTLEMEVSLRELQCACVVCGSTDRLSVDHVLPLVKGNGLCPGNAVMLCRHCNAIKWSLSLEDLPQEMADKIREGAGQFKIYWEIKHGD